VSNEGAAAAAPVKAGEFKLEAREELLARGVEWATRSTRERWATTAWSLKGDSDGHGV
jgi:hypothetical protein